MSVVQELEGNNPPFTTSVPKHTDVNEYLPVGFNR